MEDFSDIQAARAYAQKHRQLLRSAALRCQESAREEFMDRETCAAVNGQTGQKPFLTENELRDAQSRSRRSGHQQWLRSVLSFFRSFLSGRYH